MVTVVTSDNFDQEVMKSALPVFLDCYADWCGPCQMMAPVVEKFSEQYGDRVKFCKLNVDTDGDAVAAYKVMSIPNFLMFRDGRMVKNAIGGMSPSEFEDLIKELLQ